MKFGIKFPIKEVQFGKSVHYMDLNVYLDQDNTVQYRGYRKPTDAKRYLNPKSFHPPSVFNSVPFSQLLRTVRNNSKDETRSVEIEQCMSDFKNSGYNQNELIKVKEKVTAHVPTTVATNEESNTLVFPVHFFDRLKDFKSLLTDLNEEISELIGDTKVMFAIKKHSSLGNIFVRNKVLSMNLNNEVPTNQKCNGPGCRQCPLVNESKKVTVNGTPVVIPQHLNCKDKNVIYMWICRLCGTKETYFGRTIQESHDRTSGYRSCF